MGKEGSAGRGWQLLFPAACGDVETMGGGTCRVSGDAPARRDVVNPTEPRDGDVAMGEREREFRVDRLDLVKTPI